MASDDITYEIVPTKEKYPSLMIEHGGKRSALHSRMFPSKESASMLKSFRPDTFDVCIVLGVGLGYHLAPLEKLAERYSSIFLIDAVPGIEDAIRSSGVNRFLLEKKNIRILSGVPSENVSSELAAAVDLGAVSGINVVEHPASFRTFPEYYSEIKRAVSAVIDRKAGNLATVKAFGRLYLRNGIKNISRISDFAPVSSFFGRFSSAPALVLMSGPTLERSAAMIAEAQDGVFIIAVDSSLPFCLSRGIQPDFVISIDPQGYICEHFMGTGEAPFRAVTSLTAYPWDLSFSKRCRSYLSMNSHPLSQVLASVCGADFGSIDSGTGSVSGDAVRFAMSCGFSSVGCAGFDFGFSSFLTYARGTAYQRRYAGIFQNRTNPAESANMSYIMKSSGALRSDGIFTRRAFLQYRSGLEKVTASAREGLIFHIDPNGRAMEGCISAGMEEFLKGRCRTPLKKERMLADCDAVTGGIADRRMIFRAVLDKKIFPDIVKISTGEDDPAAAAEYASLAERLFRE